MSAYEILGVAGTTCELVGFLWVVAGVSQALSEEYAEHDLWHKLWFGVRYAFRYVFEEPPKPVVFTDAMSGSAGFEARLNPRKTPESQIERVERELRELRNDLEQHKKETGRRLSTVEQNLDETTQALANRLTEIETRLDKIRHSSLRHERWGARLFILGAVLTLLAIVISG